MSAATCMESEMNDEWVMVPREPTDAMLQALEDAGGFHVTGYRNMLAAAPAPTVSDLTGLDTTISDETRAALAEIDKAQRAAAVQASSIIVGSAPAPTVSGEKWPDDVTSLKTDRSPDTHPAPTRAEVLEAWPSGCRKPGSCSRNGACMYTPCRHENRAIAAEIDDAIRALAGEKP